MTSYNWQLTTWRERLNCGTNFSKKVKLSQHGELMKNSLYVRYGPTQFDDFYGDLTKLR